MVFWYNLSISPLCNFKLSLRVNQNKSINSMMVLYLYSPVGDWHRISRRCNTIYRDMLDCNALLPQAIINCPIHSEMIYPRCMTCPWHSANFKKKKNYVKSVVFGNMILVAVTKWKCHACRLVLLACHVVTLASTGCDYILGYFNNDLHPF